MGSQLLSVMDSFNGYVARLLVASPYSSLSESEVSADSFDSAERLLVSVYPSEEIQDECSRYLFDRG